jgi:hypothetical protein
LLDNFQASVNHFDAVLSHDWGRGWASELSVHQTTFWSDGTNSSNGGSTNYGEGVSTNTEYHISPRLWLGAGYRFSDFQFTGPEAPDAQAHWPFALATWYPMKDLYLSAIAGVVISHTDGEGNKENFAGTGQIEYNFHRGHLSIYGGQTPDLVTAANGLGIIRGFTARVQYYFTPRLTGMLGGGFHNSSGTGFNADAASWGVGLSERVSKYASIYARFTEIRVTETSANPSLITGAFANGKETVANYYTIGFNVSVEAFRWSWQ